MQPYQNLSGCSGVAAFSIGPDCIEVCFQNDKVYRYTYASAGKHHVDAMIDLALRGKGLNSYINRFARTLYEPF